jgi:collagenase-like PrtC family protease
MSTPLNDESPQGVEELLRELKRLGVDWVNSGDPAKLTLAAQLQGVIDHHLNSKES